MVNRVSSQTRRSIRWLMRRHSGRRDTLNDALRLAYQLICRYTSAVDLGTKTSVYPVFTGSGVTYVTVTTLTYSTVASTTTQPNDVVVGIRSANPGWGTSLGNNTSTNHSEVKSGTNVQHFLDRTIKLR